MEEKKDSILWGKEFQRWRNDYELIARAIEQPGALAAGGRFELGHLHRAASRYYQLEELQLEAMALVLERIQGEEQLMGMVAEKLARFHEKAQEDLEEAERLGAELRKMLAEDEGGAKPGQDDLDGWEDVLAEQVVLELRKFIANKSSAVRWEAVSALIATRDINSVVRFAFAEVNPKNRAMAVKEALDAVRLGAPLGREEKSMLLKMTEDMEPEVAENAWAAALKLFSRDELDAEQVRYLVQKETVEDGEETVDASDKAHLWLKVACSGGIEEGERAAALGKVEEAVWLGARLTRQEIKNLVRLLAQETGDELAHAAWSLAMELLEKDALNREEIAELVLLADRIEDGSGRKRVLDKILGALGPEKQLGDERADGILGAERVSRLFLEVVRDERPPVPARKSQPPQGGERRSIPPEPQKC